MLKFRQWRAVQCNKKRVVILGARRTGKSYTSERAALKYFKRGNNVIFLVDNLRHGQFRFNSLCSIVSRKNIRITRINYLIESIKSKNSIKFILNNEEFDKLVWFSNKYRSEPVVIVADEISDIPALLHHITCNEYRFHLDIKKIFITGTPTPTSSKEFVEAVDNGVKVFTWKCKNKLIKGLIK